METFEKFLENKFIDTREFCGRAITKDNCEDLFPAWLEDLDPQEYMDFADEYMENTLKKLKEIVQEYTDPKPEFDGITWDIIISKIK